MDPAPSPGNTATTSTPARLAIEAFHAAADPTVFPDQLTRSTCRPWGVKRLFRAALRARPRARLRARRREATRPTTRYGVWMGTPSAANGGLTWAQIARDASARVPVQGWGGFPTAARPDPSCCATTSPRSTSRVPFTRRHRPDRDASRARRARPPAAAVRHRALPDDATLRRRRRRAFNVTAHAAAPGRAARPRAVALAFPPAGLSPAAATSARRRDQTARRRSPSRRRPRHGGPRTSSARRSPPARARGTTDRSSASCPPCTGELQRLPQVAAVRAAWARDAGVPQLGGHVKPVLPIGVGRVRARCASTCTTGTEPRSPGTVTLTLPAGFSADAARSRTPLAAGRDVVGHVQRDQHDPRCRPQRGRRRAATTTTRSRRRRAGSTARRSASSSSLDRLPQAAAAPPWTAWSAPGEYPGPALNLCRAGRATRARRPPTARRRRRCVARRRPLRRRPRHRRRARHDADARRLQAPLADRLGRDRARPARQRREHVDDVQDRHLPDDDRAGRRASSGTPTTTRAAPSTAPGMQVASVGRRRPTRATRVEAKIPLADLPAAVDPAAPRPERLRLRLRHAGPDRPDPARLVDLRRRPGRPVPLGPRDAAGLHAAGRPPDDAVRAGDPERPPR